VNSSVCIWYEASLDFYFDGLSWIVLCVDDTSAVSDVFIANFSANHVRVGRGCLFDWQAETCLETVLCLMSRRSGVVCRVKYANSLPDIPFDPKFITYPFDQHRYVCAAGPGPARFGSAL